VGIFSLGSRAGGRAQIAFASYDEPPHRLRKVADGA
jgi:hypothetical protein